MENRIENLIEYLIEKYDYLSFEKWQKNNKQYYKILSDRDIIDNIVNNIINDIPDCEKFNICNNSINSDFDVKYFRLDKCKRYLSSHPHKINEFEKLLTLKL